MTMAAEKSASTAIQQNEDMRRITAWVAIVAVPTAVTGFFGQNVPYPGFGTTAGFIASVLIIVVLATGSLHRLQAQGMAVATALGRDAGSTSAPAQQARPPDQRALVNNGTVYADRERGIPHGEQTLDRHPVIRLFRIQSASAPQCSRERMR